MKVNQLRLRWSLPYLIAGAMLVVMTQPCQGNPATPAASASAYVAQAGVAQNGKSKKRVQPAESVTTLTEPESLPATDTVDTRSAMLMIVVMASGEPIKDAEVTVTVTPGADDQATRLFTDKNGVVRFSARSPALARVRVLAIGYTSDMDRIELKPGTQSLTFNLQRQE